MIGVKNVRVQEISDYSCKRYKELLYYWGEKISLRPTFIIMLTPPYIFESSLMLDNLFLKPPIYREYLRILFRSNGTRYGTNVLVTAEKKNCSRSNVMIWITGFSVKAEFLPWASKIYELWHKKKIAQLFQSLC